MIYISENKRIKATWRQRKVKKNSSIKDEVVSTINMIEVKLEFEGEYIRLEEKTLNNDWRQTWKKVKLCFMKNIQKRRKGLYQQRAV